MTNGQAEEVRSRILSRLAGFYPGDPVEHGRAFVDRAGEIVDEIDGILAVVFYPTEVGYGFEVELESGKRVFIRAIARFAPGKRLLKWVADISETRR